MQILRFFPILLAILSSTFTQAQDTVWVYGQITGDTNHLPLKKARMVVSKNDEFVGEMKAEEDGKYTFRLKPGERYKIMFDCKGYHAKFIMVDTKNIPPHPTPVAYDLEMDIQLVPKIRGFDEKLLDEPVGMGRYDSNTDTFVFDEVYSRQRAGLIQASWQAAIEKSKK